MKDELISVVITTYKRDLEILKRSFYSVVKQTYNNIEIIIIDDSPNDYPDRNKIKSFFDENHFNRKIIYRQNTNNIGACASRNEGLKLANGAFISFLDDDDEWLEEKLEKQYRTFRESDEEVALVYCGFYTLFERTGLKKLTTKQYIVNNPYHLLFRYNFIASTSIPMFRTEMLKEIGGFDLSMQAEQDLDVYLRLTKKYKINCVEEALVIYHATENNCISSNHKKRIQAIEKNNNKHIDYLKKHNDCYYYRLIMLSREFARDKRLFKALHVYFYAVFKEPFYFIKNAKYLIAVFRDRIWRYRR